MKLLIRMEAETDITEAFDWYEQRREGLGKAFVVELSSSFDAIRRGSHCFPAIPRQIRRAPMRRFPYGVFFIEQMDTIVVLAVMHKARDPRRWVARE